MFLAENPPFTNDMNSSTISIEDDDIDVTKTNDRNNKVFIALHDVETPRVTLKKKTLSDRF